jgi:putative hydrolase of the HAD superfamily
MKKSSSMTTLFLDIGGVLLTDGWVHESRKLAAQEFNLDLSELEIRHNQAFDTYELGKLSLEDYLDRVVFYEERPFTPAQFRKFMFARSQPYPEMLEMVRRLKALYGLKVVALSNEARELNAYRIQTFRLHEFVDSFVSSCFVHLRKPDPDIFRLALDISQTPARQAVYIENTPMFVRIAEGMGIQSILHSDYSSTCERLAALGLHNNEGAIRESR